MCLTVTLITNQNNIDIYNVFLISYSAENVVIYYFFTIHLPLLLEPSLSTNPFKRKYWMMFWICFLVRLNSSISLTCVTKGFSLILSSISKLLSVPFFAQLRLPLEMWLNILTSRQCKFSRTLLTISSCMLWIDRNHIYSQVLVHFIVVNSRNSLRYIPTFAFIYATS